MLNFAYIQSRTKTLLDILLGTAFKQFSKGSKEATSDVGALTSDITTMFTRAKDTPQVITGLQYFLSEETDLPMTAASSSERKMFRNACKTAIFVLSQLSSSFS